MNLRDATAADVPEIARVLGDWCRDTPWMPKLHRRDEDLWFVGELMKTHVVRVGFAGLYKVGHWTPVEITLRGG